MADTNATEDGLSTGAAFLVNTIENATISDVQAAFDQLGWPLRFDLAEAREQPVRRAPESVCPCGTTPDPGVCPIDHDKTLPTGGHCACVHTKETARA